jgi:hypothetical protein
VYFITGIQLRGVSRVDIRRQGGGYIRAWCFSRHLWDVSESGAWISPAYSAIEQLDSVKMN